MKYLLVLVLALPTISFAQDQDMLFGSFKLPKTESNGAIKVKPLKDDRSAFFNGASSSFTSFHDSSSRMPASVEKIEPLSTDESSFWTGSSAIN